MKNAYLALISQTWKYAGNKRYQYVVIYLMFIASNIAMAVQPLLLGWLVKNIQTDSERIISHLWFYILAYAGLFSVQWGLHGPARVMERELAFSIGTNFLDDLCDRALGLPMGWHQNNHSGSTINRIRKAHRALTDFFQNGFLFLHSLTKFFFSLVAISLFSPLLGFAGTIIGLLTIYVIFQFDKKLINALNECNEREHKLSSTIFDSFSNIVTVITLRLQQQVKVNLLNKVKDVYPPFRQSIIIDEWKWFTARVLIAIIYIMVIGGYVLENQHHEKSLLIAGIVTIAAYINQFTSVFQDIAWQYTEIVKYHTDVQAASIIYETPALSSLEVVEKPLPKSWQNIKIANLSSSFNQTAEQKYPGNGLQKISIDIPRGKKIALVGESGSGKSTLLRVLRGLHQANRGFDVTVDQEANFGLPAISAKICLFPQDPEVFENTIAYNFTLDIPFEPEQIEKACKIAQVGDILDKLPLGIMSTIQEKGTNISGGQRQRLALVRGILAAQTSEIVLLDEPTSSIDTKTESAIYDNLFAEFQDKAVVSSLHRLHLLSKFDYVYVLRNGKVVDHGTFAHLLETSSAFLELWKHQKIGSPL